MQIEIREYQSSDYPELVTLLQKVYGSTIDKNILEGNYISDCRSIIVAVTEDSLVGCAFEEVQVDYVRPSRVLFVTYVAVDEAYRKHGIGRKLFSFIENSCSEKNCSSIELTSADYRKEAHAFYTALGFTKKKTTVFIKEI